MDIHKWSSGARGWKVCFSSSAATRRSGDAGLGGAFCIRAASSLPQAPLRVRVFGPHTLVGEIGFFFHVRRTATVRIEAEAIVWALDQETYQRIYKSEPGQAAALLTYVVQLQGERLSFTTRQIAALQR